MNLTPKQCREAFYQAAANIEARPDSYRFLKTKVGDDSCPACMWGHVGRALGLKPETPSWDEYGSVAEILGFHAFDINMPSTPSYFETRYADEDNAVHAARRLRAFADHHWPALAELSFKEMMSLLKSGELEGVE